MSDIVFGIKIKVDGKDVESTATISREHFRQIAIDARRASDAMAGGLTSASRGIQSVSQQLAQARSAALGYLSVTQGVQTAKWILDQASAMQQLDARLRVATSNAAEYARAQAGVFEISNRWGAAVGQTAGAFARLNPVVAQLGGTSATTLRMLDGLSASLKLSGATTAETNAVLMQFAQAMGSGRVGGDEFRSMMESAEPLMRAVAGQLGKTTAELRQMAEDGKLTSSVFGNALLPAIDKLTKQAGEIPLTIGQAWQGLSNNLSRDFGREFGDQASAIGTAIKGVSGHTLELAAGVHAAETALVELAKAGVVVAAGGAAAVIAKQAQASWESVAAHRASLAVKLTEAEASVASAQATAVATAARMAEARANQAAAAEIALYGGQRAAVERELSVALGAHTAAANTAAAAEQRLAAVRAEATLAGQASAAATAAGAGAAGLARTAVAALGGPLGAAITLLTAGAAAWAIWGDAANDAARKGELATDRVRRKLEEAQNQSRYGSGDIGQARQDLEAAKEEQQRVAELFRQMPDVYRTAKFNADNAVREAATLVSVLEKQQAGAVAGVTERLSAAGEYSKLTSDLKTRESLVKDHQERLLQMQTAFRDKWLAGSETERAALSREYPEKLKVELLRQRQELANLPQAKLASGIEVARLDADQARLQAWYGEDKDTIKRSLDESATDYRGYWALVEAGERHLVEEQIRLAELRQKNARGRADQAEVVRLQGELDALRQYQATGISAKVGRGLAGDEAKAKSAGDNILIDADNARTKDLASAAAWRRGNLSLIDQELAAAREKSAADLRERQAQLDKNEALKHAPDLLAKYKQAAADQAKGNLAGIEAEIRARHEANNSWEFGATAALRAYRDEIANFSAGAGRMVANTARAAEDAWVRFATTGKVQIHDLGNVVREELARIAYQKFMAPQVSGALDWAVSAIGNAFGLTSTPGPTLSGSRAMGGPVNAGGLYRVNEERPELLTVDGEDFLMVGRRSGYVTPARAGTGISSGPAAATPKPSNLRVELVNQGATPQRVTSVQPSFDAAGMLVRIFLSDLRDNGPMRQGMSAAGIRGA